jgi:hypothetical protein
MTMQQLLLESQRNKTNKPTNSNDNDYNYSNERNELSNASQYQNKNQNQKYKKNSVQNVTEPTHMLFC